MCPCSFSLPSFFLQFWGFLWRLCLFRSFQLNCNAEYQQMGERMRKGRRDFPPHIGHKQAADASLRCHGGGFTKDLEIQIIQVFCITAAGEQGLNPVHEQELIHLPEQLKGPHLPGRGATIRAGLRPSSCPSGAVDGGGWQS